jgi:hypothetical protein
VEKEMSPLELMEDEFNRFGEKVKDITKDVFQCMVDNQEGLRKKIKEEMTTLHQLMEETRITTV